MDSVRDNPVPEETMIITQPILNRHSRFAMAHHC